MQGIATTIFSAIGKPLASLFTNNQTTHTTEQDNKFTGLWVTRDGYIRQQLLPGGRYHEARGNKQNAYTGQYQITGKHIIYRDDTGFTIVGDFRGTDMLYQGGHFFYREHTTQYLQ